MEEQLIQRRNEIQAMLLQQARIAEANYLDVTGGLANTDKVPAKFKPAITQYLMTQKKVYSDISFQMKELDVMDPMYDTLVNAREELKQKIVQLSDILNTHQEIANDYPNHVGSLSDANDLIGLKQLADILSGNYKKFDVKNGHPMFIMHDKTKVWMMMVRKAYGRIFRKAVKENNQFILIANEAYNNALQRGEDSWNENSLIDRIYQILNDESGEEGTVDPMARTERLLSLSHDKINGNPSFIDWLKEDPTRDPNNWVAEGVYDDSWIRESIKIDPKIVMNGMVQWLLERVSNQWRSGYEKFAAKQDTVKNQQPPVQETN